MRKIMFIALFAVTSIVASAQEKKVIELPAWIQDVKLSGYGMVQYQADDKYANNKDENGNPVVSKSSSNSFNLRLVRLALDGRVKNDWYWKIQMQVNGTTKDDKSAIRLVDAFAEWQKYKFFMVKGGQFKRPFTFENPMHPITQGFMSYSQNVTKLAGFSDRTGEQASNGRDIGVQIQGDFLPNAAGRSLFHYQVGVFNGQGINTKDVDNRKDIIGGVWFMPVKGMRIGAFGWTGSRGTEVTDQETGKKYVVSTPKNRYALSGEYVTNDWTFRTEYIHSTGTNVAQTASYKADGYYALCIAPVIKNKFHVKARYDLYRDNKEWDSSKTFYEIGADYLFSKNLQLNIEYARVNDRTIADPDKHNYNLVDVELNFRF